MLYLVPTPIGNREDITQRAIRTLSEVDLVLAEDTRTSRPLLQHYGIATPLRAYHAHNEHAIAPQLVAEMTFSDYVAAQRDRMVRAAGFPVYDYNE